MKKNVFLSSIIVIALCLSVIAGSTFALFTSESAVDATVTSGKVSISATVDSIVLDSTLGSNLPETSATYDATANEITLDKLVPGDFVTFNITVSNDSDVSINYRTLIQKVADNGLWSGLEVSIDGSVYNGLIKKANWETLLPGSADIVVPVKVSLPEDRGNEYQDKTCTFTYTVEAIQGNAEVINADVWDGSVDTSWFDASASTYTIDSAADLAGFSQLVSEGKNFSRKTVTLGANIDLVDIPWTPIGPTSGKCFSGTFDGNGHTILGLNVSNAGTGSGFFRNVVSGTVKNVIFDGAAVLCGRTNMVGIVTGYAYGTCTFENITVQNSRVEGYGKVGAIVGMGADPGDVTTVTGCTVTNTVVKGTYNCGGLIGMEQGAITVTDCVANATWEMGDVASNYVTDDAGICWVYGTYHYAAWATNYTDYTDPVIDGIQHVGVCH